ncbi:MAG: 4Fe-4S binding protein [Enterobacteriaceae bacterium]|nr:4Fe-4S binding protein [Enterobacteriaceae bacterium]
MSLIIWVRLLVFFSIVLISLIVNASDFRFLELLNNNLFCTEHDCSVKKSHDQKLIYNYDNKVFELVENNSLVKYYFYTTDIVYIPAYSLKPVDLLVSLESNGIISDLRLINHSEPIFITGINIEKLLEAVVFYRGINIKEEIDIGENIGIDNGSVIARKIDYLVRYISDVFKERVDFKNDEPSKYGVPIIFGATVTSLVLHDTILKSSRYVAGLYNIVENFGFNKGELDYCFCKDLSLEKLFDLEVLKQYIIEQENIKLYYSNISLPVVGKNILGIDGYCRLVKKYGFKKSAILILNKKQDDPLKFWSFIGSAFIKGVYDRFFIKQGFDTFTFRYEDYRPVHDLDLINKDLKNFESGIYIIKDDKFKAANPFELVLFVNKNVYKDKEYKYPAVFFIPTSSRLHNIWLSNIYYIIIYFAFWMFVLFIFLSRNKFSRSKKRLNVVYWVVLLISVFFGIFNSNQPSIVNLFALMDNISGANVFLLTPILAVGLLLMIVSTFLWGKAVFCGWICPFGAVQEIIFKVRVFLLNSFMVFNESYEFSKSLRLYRFKLVYFRYIVLLVLIFFLYFYGIEYAEKVSDYIEPFKTVWTIGIFNRGCYGFYVLILLSISILMYRFFCRYICPLGTALSVLSFIPVFRIDRRHLCSKCAVCANNCQSYAINSNGIIDHKECFGCFSCINTMNDNNKCVELIIENKRRNRV